MFLPRDRGVLPCEQRFTSVVVQTGGSPTSNTSSQLENLLIWSQAQAHSLLHRPTPDAPHPGHGHLWLVLLSLLIGHPQVETIWDLGPFCCSACTWTHVSSGNKIQRNYKRLKITACMRSWGKLWITRYEKTKKPTATSKESGAKQGTAPVPCTQHHQGVSRSPKPRLRPHPWTCPYPHPIQGTSSPFLGKQAREPVVCSRSPLLQQGPQ